MKENDITVIVPTYNVEKYIGKCLKSLLNQTYKNFEIWAVDDGSPDNSKEIIQKYQKVDNRIKYIYKKNGGYGSVLEYCIKKINTKYFLICDPDDWLTDDALQDLHIVAEQNNADVVVGDRFDVYMDNLDEKKIVRCMPKSIKPNKVYLQPELQLFALGECSPHGKLYKTNVVKNISLPHKVSFTDFELFLYSLLSANRTMYLNKPMAYYLRDRPGNSMTDIRTSVIKDYQIVWQSTFNQLKENKYSNNVLFYRLYLQFETVMSEYSKISNHCFKDNYDQYIYSMLRDLRPYKNRINIALKGRGTIHQKIVFDGLMDSRLYKLFVRLFVWKSSKKR